MGDDRHRCHQGLDGRVSGQDEGTLSKRTGTAYNGVSGSRVRAAERIGDTVPRNSTLEPMQTTTTHPAAPGLLLLQRSAAAREVAAVLLFGALTAVSAQLQIPTQPVPTTAQVFVVLLAGALLGPRLGFLSQLTYLAFGIAGAPVFAGGKFGILTLLGSTGGYLVAFPLAAYLAGVVALRVRSQIGLMVGLLLASLVLLFVGGAGLAVWAAATGHQQGLGTAISFGLTVGVLPFLPLDILKVIAAALVAWPAVKRTS